MVSQTAAKVADSIASKPASQESVRGFLALSSRSAQLRDDLNSGNPRDPAAESEELAEIDRQMSSEEAGVERLIQDQVSAVLARSGVGYRLPGSAGLFPPVVFRYTPLPRLLVVSPRDRIDRVASVLLDPRTAPDEVEELEARVSKKGYIGLVVPIGGLGVFPSMVPDGTDLRNSFIAVAHEWTHHYLALRPLGWKYAVGSESDQRMVTVNETVAEIVGQQIGDEVYRDIYRGAEGETQAQSSSGRTDRFRSEMRAIRLEVDRLLAEGKIGDAEAFMASSRDRLQAEGFYIRKLNQAYFAFYGSYAAEPSLSGPQGERISERVHALRDGSPTLGAFLSRVSEVGSYQAFSQLSVSR
ncbi:MAG TPA: hypothetical protein VHS06_06870 [Chloroflexota bacterium]|nr:hypothetical protein [Chloroflexota bacterium]